MSRRKFDIDIFAVNPKTWRTFVATAQACVSTHMDGSHMVTHILKTKKKRETLCLPTLTYLYCQTPIPFHVSVPDNTNVSWLPHRHPMVDCQPWLYSTDTARRFCGAHFLSCTCRSAEFSCVLPVCVCMCEGQGQSLGLGFGLLTVSSFLVSYT